MSDLDVFDIETAVPKGQSGRDQLRKLRPFAPSNTSTRAALGQPSFQAFSTSQRFLSRAIKHKTVHALDTIRRGSKVWCLEDGATGATFIEIFIGKIS
jgi:hypothetical protein